MKMRLLDMDLAHAILIIAALIGGLTGNLGMTEFLLTIILVTLWNKE